MPSESNSLSSDIQNNHLSQPSNIGLIQQPLLQFVNSGTVDQYQPQTQQFYSLQETDSNKIPLSVHNPTYLVTQSNNLYNHHQQQLFKPNLNYVSSLNSNIEIIEPIHEVASAGQILEAARDPANQIHPQYPGIQENSSINNNPKFAALIARQQQPYYNQATENSIINNEFQNTQGGFIVSNYFDNNGQNSQSYHRENDQALAQANLDLHNQLIVHNAQQYAYDDDQTLQPQTESTDTNAYKEHQKLVQQHFGSSPLRIFVPDDEYQDNSVINQLFN